MNEKDLPDFKKVMRIPDKADKTKDLCESCQHSWIIDGKYGPFMKKCMYSGTDLERIVVGCNRYLKEGHKGNVTGHDSKYNNFERRLLDADILHPRD